MTMTKEEILKYVESRQGHLIGYFQVPFPVYVVHVAYDSIDSNPFFPLYRAILRYVKSCPKMDSLPYFAKLIGFELELVKQCVRHLKEDGMIRMSGDVYKISDDAERKYIAANSRPTVKVTGSFLVDGKDLKLLPSFVYKSEPRLYARDYNVSAHLPIDMAMNASIGPKIVRLLDSSQTLEMLRLETTGNNFDVLAFDKKFLRDAFAVFYTDNANEYHKEIIYEGFLLQCKATGSAETYTIELTNKANNGSGWAFVPNMGYNISDQRKMKDVAIYAQNDGWYNLLSDRYKTNSYVFQIETDALNRLPIVDLREDLLEASSAPLDVIEDAKKGYIDFPVTQNGCVRIKTQHELQGYIEFMDTLQAWNRARDIDGKTIKSKLESMFSGWRKLMVMFGLYDELEKIDCDCFISIKR